MCWHSVQHCLWQQQLRCIPQQVMHKVTLFTSSLCTFPCTSYCTQLARMLGSYPDDAFYSVIPTAFLGFVVFAISLAALRGNFGLQAWGKEDDIY